MEDTDIDEESPAKVPTEEGVRTIVRNVRIRMRRRRVLSTMHCINNASASAIAQDGVSLPVAHPVSDQDEAKALDLLNSIAEAPKETHEKGHNIHRPPQGTAWARVRTNLSPADEGRLQVYAAPYLGDSDAAMKASSELEEIIKETKDEEDQTLEADKDLRKSPHGKHLGKKALQQGDDSDVESETFPAMGDTEHGEGIGIWSREFKRVSIFESFLQFEPEDFDQVKQHLSSVLKISQDDVCKYFSNALFRKSKWLVEEKRDEGVKEHRRNLLEWIRTEKRTCTVDILKSNSVDYFYCRRCKTHDCSMHGCGVNAIPKIIPYDETRKNNLKEEAKQEIQKTCEFAGSLRCYYYKSQDENGALNEGMANETSLSDGIGKMDIVNETANGASCGETANLSRLDDEQGSENKSGSILENNMGARMMLNRFRVGFGDDNCRIAEALNALGMYSKVTCIEVGNYCEKYLGPVASGADKKPGKSSKRPGVYRLHKKSIKALLEDNNLVDYEPCNHEGACSKKNCKCLQDGVYCEKYCACCSPRVNGERTHAVKYCDNFYRGCKCNGKNSHCDTKKCDCVELRRECDPDICKCCKKFPDGSFGSTFCKNMSLRNNTTSRIVCGHSVVHGWGSYTTAPVKKGALIGQYTGETITRQESELRGRVYDAKVASYLFNITPKYDVDSTVIGNKLKYINHSTNNNCFPKIVRLDGNVIVGIFASRDIKAFEELLFTYGWADDKFGKEKEQGAKRSRLAPSTTSKTVSKGKKRQVDEDEEVDDNSDSDFEE